MTDEAVEKAREILARRIKEQQMLDGVAFWPAQQAEDAVVEALTRPASVEELVEATDDLLERLIAAVLAHTEVGFLNGEVPYELRMHKAAVKADMIVALRSITTENVGKERG